MSAISIPLDVLKTLTCINCKNYLSVGPIITVPEGLQCGRCIRSLDVSSWQAYEFENLAKLIQFPCKFDTLGCTSFGKFNEIKEHELTCYHRTVKCPALDINCEETLFLREVMNHFQSVHKDLVLPTPSFVLRPDDVFPKNYIVGLDEHKCLLQLKKTEDDDKVRFKSVLSLLDFGPDKKISYLLDADNFLTIRGHAIKPFSDIAIGADESEFLNLDLEAIRLMLNTSNNVTFQVKLDQQKISMDSIIRDQLDCPVCLEIMHPPIYSCITGHSVCCYCKIKLDSCPSCKKEYLGTRNFAVEKLVETIPFNCHYSKQGCTFVGTPARILDHEKDCTFKPANCPMPKCRWQGLLSDTTKHLKSHSIEPIKSVSLKCYQWRARYNRISEEIIIHNNSLFRIEINIGPSERGYAKMEQIELHENEEPLYEFELNFKSLNHEHKDTFSVWGFTNGDSPGQGISGQRMSALNSNGYVLCTLSIIPL